MSTKKNKRASKKEEGDFFDAPITFLEQVSPRTWRGIGGTLLVVLVVLMSLSAFGGAGVAGEHLFAGVSFLFGVGYYILTLLLALLAFSLFKGTPRENTLRTMRIVGGTLALVSFLGMVGTLAPLHAGKLGGWVSGPLVHYFDVVASMVVLVGLFVTALILMFEGDLWARLWEKMQTLRSSEEEKPTDTFEEEDPALYSVSTPSEHSEDSSPSPLLAPQKNSERAPENDVEDDDFLEDAPETGSEHSPATSAPHFEPSPEYIVPPLSLLELDRGKPNVGDTKARANLIRRTLQHFKIPVEMDEIIVGPTVTRYSLKPAEGVRLSKIVALQSNLELALAASPIRIEAPIPGKSLVGIEVPNTGKAIVGLGGLLSSPEFADAPHPLLTALGKDITGKAHYGNISKMPHLLVAGTTGSGKSVMIHTLVTSLLYRNSPERLRFIMVDPKRVELTLYNNIPHLLTPVITDAKKCILSLKWAAKEMDRRYDLLQQNRVQDIAGYHTEVVNPALALYRKQVEKGKDGSSVEMPDLLPHIVIIIDELADIMSAYPRELESAIVRLAQMSRAVGIHLILSTQRPSVNVITGLIKANIPTRIALKVASLIDSRTILDQPGAEKLLGAGDMLYLSGDMAKPRRIQSPFLSTSEVKNLVAFLIKHNSYVLPAGIDLNGNENGTQVEDGGNSAGSGISFEEMERSEELDPLYDEVRAFVVQEKKMSTSLLQRRFKIGYGRAARLLDQLEANGIISAQQENASNKGRDVLVSE